MNATRKALVGEHVRYKGRNGTEFEVIYTTNNIVKGSMYCDEIRHGYYEIIKRKLVPWTMLDAVQCFAKQGTLVLHGKDGSQWIVSAIEVDRVKWKAGGWSEYERLAIHCKMTDGSQCASEEWEVVE